VRLAALLALLLAAPAAAQDHSAHSAPADPHAGHDMSAMEAPAAAEQTDPHAGHGMQAPTGASAPAPAPADDRAADRYWGAAAMARAERAMRREHGGGSWHQLRFDLAEVQLRAGRDGYRWDGEAWIGGDIDRLVLKSEGSGSFGGAVDDAEVHALYGRALDPYWTLQAGIRQDLARGSRATYAAIGVEGMAPYWLQLDAALFLSTNGDLLSRIEGAYDQRITQDLVLQPRMELDLAAQDVPQTAIGAGLSQVELGLRLRYERARAFAPYLGISWDRRLGRTADFARARGDGTGGTALVAGVRAWF